MLIIFFFFFHQKKLIVIYRNLEKSCIFAPAMHFILIKNIRIMKKFGLFFISAFMMVLEGLRDRYIGSLFRVDEPVPDDSLSTLLTPMDVRL